MNSVGANIKHFRLEKNISQGDMSAALGVSKSTVSGWESGRLKPDVAQLEAIADYLDVPVEELIYDGDTRRTRVRYITRYISTGSKSGIGFGAALAIVISYVKWQSIGWAVIHGLLNWIYVIYYILKYVW